MWTTASSNAQALIRAKLEDREKALSLAPAFVEDVHSAYLKATGKVTGNQE